jgi:hypothetical protein
MFYRLLLNMWKLNRLTIAQVDAAVIAGRITADEAESIKEVER